MDKRIGFPDIPQVGSVETGHPVSITGIIEAFRPTGPGCQRSDDLKLRREVAKRLMKSPPPRR
jgi:hypothetical protein